MKPLRRRISCGGQHPQRNDLWRKREVTVVGVASSPEFVFAVAPGRCCRSPSAFGVLWMGREALGRAFDLDGAFNDVVLQLEPGANARLVANDIDRLLERHGGRGAYGRDRMLSAQFMADELTSLRTMAHFLPPFFLLVAAFLLNVSLSRLVATERSNIGLLKSFRLQHAAIALHYAKFALIFGIAGGLVGMIGGRVVGGFVGGIYARIYRIPELGFDAGAGRVPERTGDHLAGGNGRRGAGRAQGRASATCCCTGATGSRGFQPAGSIAGAFCRGARWQVAQVARRILRFPRRSLTTVVGIALAMGLLVTTQHFPLAIDRIVAVTFGVAQRMDVLLRHSRKWPMTRSCAMSPAARCAQGGSPAQQRGDLRGRQSPPAQLDLRRAGGRIAEPPARRQPRGRRRATGWADAVGQPGGQARCVAGGHGAHPGPPTATAPAPSCRWWPSSGPILPPRRTSSSTRSTACCANRGRVTARHLLIDSRQRAAFSARVKQRHASSP